MPACPGKIPRPERAGPSRRWPHPRARMEPPAATSSQATSRTETNRGCGARPAAPRAANGKSAIFAPGRIPDARSAASSRARRSPSLAAPPSYPHRGHDAFGKNLLGRNVAMSDALLVGIAQELLERRPVLFDAVRERVAVEQVAHLARVGRQPSERITRDRGIEQALEAAPLRLQESIVEIARDPGVRVEHALLNRDDVHDRPHPGSPIVGLLHLEVIREQPHHVRVALQERVGRTRDQRAIDLARGDHLAQGLVAHARELDPLRDGELDLLDAAGLVGAGLVPMDVLELDAVLIVEPAAHVDGGGVGPFRRADGLALEIGRRPDFAVLVDVERRESKQAGADHRQADDVGRLSRHLRTEFRERQLAYVPLAVEGKACEYLVVAERQPGMVDALGRDEAQPEIAEVVVVGGGDGELDARHASPWAIRGNGVSPPSRPWRWATPNPAGQNRRNATAPSSGVRGGCAPGFRCPPAVDASLQWAAALPTFSRCGRGGCPA